MTTTALEAGSVGISRQRNEPKAHMNEAAPNREVDLGSNRKSDLPTEQADTPVVTHDEAKEAALRLIAGAFRRDGEDLDHKRRPRFSIPCRPDRDDDCVVMTYIKQQEARTASSVGTDDRNAGGSEAQ